MSNPDSPLRINIEDGELVIRVGIERLDGHEDHPDFPELPITDHYAWARSVANAMEEDRGDGATPVCLFVDQSILSAIDNGALGLNYDVYAKRLKRHRKSQDPLG